MLNESKWTWRGISLISIAATAILIVGFVYAVNDIIHPVGEVSNASLPQQTEAPQTAEVQEYKIVALGDSLAKGTGDSNGEGFVKRTVAGLAANDGKAELLGNLGINGQTTAGLQDKLKEEGVKYALRQANVILLSVGGNDLFRGSDLLKSSGGQASTSTEAASTATPSDKATAPAETGAPGSNSTPAADQDLTPESLLAALPEAAAKLGEILETLAEINPQAQIYYVGLYNPFGDVPELLVPGNQAVTAWNNAAMDIINQHSNMTLVPTFDLFNRHLDKYLSSDHFHPNADGYQRMGERITQAVR